ncbi:MAG: PAS domain S-box protein [Bryobacteraceae bacterium]|jgi:signal transduction histidine kinase
MTEIASIAAVAILLLLAAWVATRFRRWRRDRQQLTREVSELASHALVLCENSSQAIVKFDATGIIRMVNPAAEERFGYSPDELLGRSIMRLLPQANLDVRLPETLELCHKDGSLKRLPFKAATSGSGIYLFFDKATPKPPLSTVVGQIAGRYENLLTTITCYTGLALVETPGNSPLRRDLEEIMTASSRAASLTKHLVAFSGSQFVPVEPLDLSRLVNDLRAELPPRIDFSLQPTVALANADFLRQAILLLCASARGRMRETDRLQVKTRKCDLTAPRLVRSGELQPGTYGSLTIYDSGRPLDAEVREHLLEPLYLIENMDLSPIYGMVQRLGGGIDFTTGSSGTIFEILLPFARKASAQVLDLVET